MAIVWLYLIKPHFLLKHINKIAFLCAALFLIKQNFPFYCLMLLGCIAIAEKFSFKKIIRLALYSIISLAIFFLIQAIVLKGMGLLEAYINGIAKALAVHSGTVGKYFSTQRYPDPPGITELMPRYFELIRAWYTEGRVNTLTFFGYTEVAAANKIMGHLLAIQEEKARKTNSGAGAIFNLMLNYFIRNVALYKKGSAFFCDYFYFSIRLLQRFH